MRSSSPSAPTSPRRLSPVTPTRPTTSSRSPGPSDSRVRSRASPAAASSWPSAGCPSNAPRRPMRPPSSSTPSCAVGASETGARSSFIRPSRRRCRSRDPSAVAPSGLAGPSGWIPVERETLETSAPNVFAIGDVTAITLANGKLLPKAGVFAHAEAEVVAAQIAARLGSGTAAGRFDGHGYCWVELGNGVAGFAAGDFFATPDPALVLRRPGPTWHAGKVLFERYWLSRGLEHGLAGAGLRLGSALLRVPRRP